MPENVTDGRFERLCLFYSEPEHMRKLVRTDNIIMSFMQLSVLTFEESNHMPRILCPKESIDTRKGLQIEVSTF